MTTITIKCGKCDGAGRIRAFAHVAGGTCFACKGAGTFTRTEASVARAARRAADRRAETERRVADANAAADARAARYANDPRIGPKTAARVARFHAVAAETFRTLEDMDAGKITRDRQPWVWDNLAR